MLELDFGDMPEKLKEEYLDIYNGIQSEIVSTTRFDENSDLSREYLGRIDMTKTSKIKVEETFPISEQGYTVGKLLDGTEFQILLATGASKSFMSKSNILAYPLLNDAFSVLGSSRFEVLSVLDLKDAFHSLRLCNITIPLQCIIFVSKNTHGIKYLTVNLAIIYKCYIRLFTK